MIQTCINLFKNKDIRKKIFFTLVMLFIVRLGNSIPAPRVNAALFGSVVGNNNLLTMLNMLGGGTFQRLSIFSLGVGPYITSSIIIQLLSMDVIPYLTEQSKAGQQGKMVIDKITRYLAVILAFVQSTTMIWAFDNGALGVSSILTDSSWGSYFYIATVMTAGTLFLLWLADRISQFGIGNGVSMIIFTGIVSNLPTTFNSAYSLLINAAKSPTGGYISFVLYILMYLAIIVLVVFMQLATRKIPIQYTSSSMMKGKGDMTYLPLKINSASVLPVIFASAIMTAPTTILSFFEANDFSKFLSNILSLEKPIGLVIYAVLIVLLTFFYTNLQVDPDKIADNLSKSGTYIPGIRPGKETKEYLNKVLNRITCLGALFILVIALLPYIVSMVSPLTVTTAIGGTGIIIVVGVATETFSSLKGMLTQKKYRGFID